MIGEIVFMILERFVDSIHSLGLKKPPDVSGTSGVR